MQIQRPMATPLFKGTHGVLIPADADKNPQRDYDKLEDTAAPLYGAIAALPKSMKLEVILKGAEYPNENLGGRVSKETLGDKIKISYDVHGKSHRRASFIATNVRQSAADITKGNFFEVPRDRMLEVWTQALTHAVQLFERTRNIV